MVPVQIVRRSVCLSLSQSVYFPNTAYPVFFVSRYLYSKSILHIVLPAITMPTVRPRTTLYLWEFLLQLLDGKDSCPAISWVNRDKGEFILKDQAEIAKLWGKVKGRPQMDKIKLGRAMRYYYKKKLLAKVENFRIN